MKGETREVWIGLCEQAAVEKDPVLLLELVKRINDLLEQKEKRLRKQRMDIAENEKLIWWPV